MGAALISSTVRQAARKGRRGGKIKNLRTAFHREHKSQTHTKSGSSPIKRSKWFAYDLLIFLLNVDNPRLGYSSEVEPQAEQPIRKLLLSLLLLLLLLSLLLLLLLLL